MSYATLKIMGRIVLIFGAVCYLTSCAMAGGGDVLVREEVPADGGTIGPFTVEEGGTVLEVDVEQRISGRGYGSHKRWSFITAELLGADGQYLTGFGGEMWDESGRGWQEDDERYETKLTIPEAGSYSLRFQTESDVSTSKLSPIRVEVASQRGSTLPHYVAAWLAFAAGGGLWLWGNARKVTQEDARSFS